jgi:PAS domain S-box-containing protein
MNSDRESLGMRVSSSRLRTRLALIALVALIPAVVAVVYLQWAARREARARTFADSLRVARLVASSQAGVFGEARGLLRTLAHTPSMRTLDGAACAQFLGNVLHDHPGYFNIIVDDREGRMICSGAPVAARTNARERAWFQQVLDGRTAVVGGYQLSTTSGQPTLIVGQPLLGEDGEVARVLSASIRFDQLPQVVGDASLPHGTTVTLFDDTGRILARVPGDDAWIGRRLPDEALLARVDEMPAGDLREGTGVDGVRRLYATVPIEAPLDTQLFLRVGVDSAEAFAASDHLLTVSLWLLGLMSLTVVAAGLVAGEAFVSRPLAMLTRVAGRIAHGDLSARPQLAGTAPGFAGIGSAIGGMASALDARQEELRVSEERYRLLFRQNPQPMWVFDATTFRFLEVNDAAVQQYGYTRDEFLAMRIIDVRPADDVPNVLDSIAAAEPGGSYFGTWRHRTKSGVIMDVAISSNVIRFDGRLAWLVLVENITERKQAEARLRESEERFRRIAETVSEVFWISDVETQSTVYVSPSYEGIWGRSRESLYQNARSFLESVHPEDLPRVLKELQVKRQGLPFDHEYRIIRLDGQVRWIWDRGFPVFDEAGRVLQYVGSAQDITERVAAQAALLDAEERTLFALEAANVGIWEADLTTGVAFWSEICERMHGLEPGTFGKTFDSFLECIHAADRLAVEQAIDAAIKARQQLLVGYRTVGSDGGVRHLSMTGHFFYDERHTPARAAGIVVDVTDRLSLEEQLRQSQKMEAVGQLAGGIAHDFNNMLSAILGYADMVGGELADDHPHRGDIEEIAKAARRASALTQQLLAFSRKQILAPAVLQLGDIVNDLMPMLRRLLGATIDLRAVLADSGHVRADAGQMEQLLVNLAVNARDAMRQGGQLRIETADVVLDDAYARQHPAMRTGPHVKLAVSDTGCGMDAETQTRVFEPFFTTKEKGQGTGLGLAVVYGIVKQSGGHIVVESQPASGTTFTVYLPVTHEPLEQPQPRTLDRRSLRGSETVLLVEDEDVVRDFVTKVLTRYGYTVHATADAVCALTFAAEHRGRIDLVLTDVVLPQMSGRAVASELQRQHPEARVLYTSGFTEHGIVREGVLEGGIDFLPKPFTAQTLARRVRDLLDGRPC